MGAEALDTPDESFDAVVCGLGLMYVPEVAAALGEMHRVLVQGGRAVAAVWGARARCGWADIFPIVEARVESDVCPMFFQLGTGDSLAHAFSAAGFRDVCAERLSTFLEYTSGDDAADAAFVGGPVAMAYSRFDEPTRLAARTDYLDSIAPFRAGDGYRVPGEFVVVRGTKPLLPHPRVLEHLRRQVHRIRDRHVGDRAIRVAHRRQLRHHEADVGRQVELVDARHDLVAKLRIEMHPVRLEQLLRRRVVAL